MRNFSPTGWPARTAIVAFFAVWMVLGSATPTGSRRRPPRPAFRERDDMRLVNLKGRRVPFAARKDLSSAPWRVPEAFYENQESWLQ